MKIRKVDLIFGSVKMDSRRVWQDDIMGSYKRLGGGVSGSTVPKGGRATRWWVNPRPIPSNNCNVGLIEGRPVVYFVTEWSKTHICVVSEILPAFLSFSRPNLFGAFYSTMISKKEKKIKQKKKRK